jgi:hypothetical protein
MTLCAKPNLASPNPKQIQLEFQTKNRALADDAVFGHSHVLIPFPSFG